jgi:Protein of unknown function (DUF3604)
MLKKVLLFSLLCLVLGAVWLQMNWTEVINAGADPWEPPVQAARAEPPLSREPCAESEPLRRAWFGDLHVHTAYSFDARSRDMMGTPDDAYRYSRGGEIGLGPFDENRVGQRRVRIERPLDFAAVTDHAEWIGEINVCIDPEMTGYKTPACQAFRGEIETPDSLVTRLVGKSRMMNIIGLGGRKEDLCGPQGIRCREGLKGAWETSQRATEEHYDRSSNCTFTSFHGYEYSNSTARSKIHRNVIFRNERVPELPVSSLEEPDPFGLWESLDRLCNKAEGDCEAISIPHNPNVSNGRLFSIFWRDEPVAEQRRRARLRGRYEPLVEMMQIKGESECKAGMWQVFGEDELCDFEKMRGEGDSAPEDCEAGIGAGAIMGEGCQSRLDFVRYALIEGMAEEERMGVNPYRFGFAGSTDSHNASPGDVDEENYDGCCADRDATVEGRLGGRDSNTKSGFAGRSNAARNPGGLMGVWAQENTRDSLFDAMKRREVFATSGPRISPRFFAGENLPEDICSGEFVSLGDEHGVPMGGVLENQLAESPVFAAAVAADPEGGLLQRLQIVKVWHDDAGQFHQAVHDIAGNAQNGAGVDMTSCAVTGVGESQLCGRWQDPGFDAGQSAAYYVRAIENPSCRWSWRQCLQLPETERPPACSDPAIPKTIQERAWSSPIWYSP